jgi:hypothetical protein
MSGFSINKKDYFIASSTADSTEALRRDNYRIKRVNNHNYITVGGKSVFLDYDTAPVYENDLLAFFKNNFQDPAIIPGNSPFVFLVFIIDEKGQIISKGFDRNVNMDSYQQQFFELLKKVNGKFSPAVVDGKKVASRYSFYFDYRTFSPIGKKNGQ